MDNPCRSGCFPNAQQRDLAESENFSFRTCLDFSFCLCEKYCNDYVVEGRRTRMLDQLPLFGRHGAPGLSRADYFIHLISLAADCLRIRFFIIVLFIRNSLTFGVWLLFQE